MVAYIGCDRQMTGKLKTLQWWHKGVGVDLIYTNSLHWLDTGIFGHIQSHAYAFLEWYGNGGLEE
jgi:hypothetical protein